MVLEAFLGQRLAAFDFARLAFETVERLTGEQAFRRREPGLKPFFEEVLPIATFAKAWEKPERHLTIEYFGPNHPYDAAVAMHGNAISSGFFEPHYHLEVTSALFEHEHLEREALARHGFFFGDPHIHGVGSDRRGNRRIISQATAHDGETPVTDLQTWVQQAIADKTSPIYLKPCLLLVRAVPSRPLTLTEWCSVATAAFPAAQASQFSGVLLVDWYNGTVHSL